MEAAVSRHYEKQDAPATDGRVGLRGAKETLMAHRKVKSSLLMSALMFFCAADVLVAALEPEE